MSLFDVSSDEEGLSSKTGSEDSDNEAFVLPPPPRAEGGSTTPVLMGSRLGGGGGSVAAIPFSYGSSRSGGIDPDASREKSEVGRGGSVFGSSIAAALEQRRREREDRAHARLKQRRLEEQQQPELAKKDKEVGVFITSSYRDVLRRRLPGVEPSGSTSSAPSPPIPKEEDEDPLESFIQSLEKEHEAEPKVTAEEERMGTGAPVPVEELQALVVENGRNEVGQKQVPPPPPTSGNATAHGKRDPSRQTDEATGGAASRDSMNSHGAAEKSKIERETSLSDLLCRKLLSVASLEIISQRCEVKF